ncbi:uncharacterized protein M6G45_017799 [Spheniscus humboldti]
MPATRESRRSLTTSSGERTPCGSKRAGIKKVSTTAVATGCNRLLIPGSSTVLTEGSRDFLLGILGVANSNCLGKQQCEADMAIVERTPSPGPPQGPSQFPLGSECWSVGANSHQREQDGAVLAQSSAGRRQGLAEQRCPGTGISTPLPILAVAGWAASLVHGEGPPVPGRMGQANCCCGSREALSDAEAMLSTDVRLTRGRKRSERRLLLLEEELVIAKLQHGGTTLHPQLCLALDQLWVVSGGKEVAGEEEEEEEEGSNEDRTSIILIWPTSSCVATFGSRALKELWVGTLLG